MNSERFDAMMRTLDKGTTRRGVLGVLAGTAGLGLRETAAKSDSHMSCSGNA